LKIERDDDAHCCMHASALFDTNLRDYKLHLLTTSYTYYYYY
jgi:hypothetical protein